MGNGCDKYRAWLADYVDGELSPIKAVEFQERHATCPSCTRQTNELIALSDRLREVYLQFAPSPELIEEIRAGLPDPKRLLEVPLFGEIARALGFVDDATLHTALDEQKSGRMQGNEELVGIILIRNNAMTQEQVDKTLNVQSEQGSLETIGGFEILEQVGRGGMGVVYRAQQMSLDREVAIKILYPRLSTNRKFVASFLAESHSVAQLNHPNIITGIDSGEQDGYIYLAMEFVDGPTLRQLLKEQGRVSEQQSIDIGIQVAEALEYARKLQFIHRDIKPDNIMIDKSGRTKVCDLGLAKRGEVDILAKEGEVLGTPHYLSPEQAKGKTDLDTRTDIYSLGATLYHAMTGSTPFTGENPQEIMSKHVFSELVPPRAVAPEMSEGMEAIILKMMAKDREQRYATPLDLQRDLELLKANKRPTALTEKLINEGKLDPKELLRRKRSPAAVFSFIAVVAVCIAIAAYLANSERKRAATNTPRKSSTAATIKATPKPSADASVDPRVAQSALDDLNELVKNSPDDFAAIMSAASDLRIRYKGTVPAVAASGIIATTKVRLAEHAKKVIEGAMDSARKDIAHGNFKDALAAMTKLPESIKLSSEYSRLPQYIATILGEIDAKLNAETAEIAKLCDKHLYISAEDRIALLIRTAPAERVNSLRSLFDACTKQREEYVGSQSKLALAAILDHTLMGDFKAAKVTLDKYIADPLFVDYKPRFEGAGNYLEPIERVVRTAYDRMAELVGKKSGLRLAGELDERSFKINAINPNFSLDVMEYSPGMPKSVLKLSELDPLTIAKFAREKLLRATIPLEKGNAMVDVAIYELFCGKFYESDMDAKSAEGFGASLAAFNQLREGSKPLILGRFAVKLYADFAQLADANFAEILARGERLLSEFGESAIVSSNRVEIERKLCAARLRSAGMFDMFKGNLEVIDATKVKFTYDFSKPNQLDDFAYDPDYWAVKDSVLQNAEDKDYNHPLHHLAQFQGPVDLALEYRTDRPNSLCARVGGSWLGINSHNATAGIVDAFNPKTMWETFNGSKTGFNFTPAKRFSNVLFSAGDATARIAVDDKEVLAAERKPIPASVEIRDLGFSHFKRVTIIGVIDPAWLALVAEINSRVRAGTLQRGCSLTSFSDIYFSRVAERAVVSGIDAVFPTAPSPKIKGNTWSLKYECYVFVQGAGEYEFSISTSARSRLRVDGASLSDNLSVRGDTAKQISVSTKLTPGLHKIELIIVNDELLSQMVRLQISYGTPGLSPIAPLILYSDPGE